MHGRTIRLPGRDPEMLDKWYVPLRRRKVSRLYVLVRIFTV